MKTNPPKLNFLFKGSYILAFALIMNLLTHLPFMNLEPRSVHVWRQCNTLAVARNFYNEDMNILKPRVDRRLDTDGVTGMQFPSYEYIVASGYHIFGEHTWVHRSVSLLISFWGMIGMFLLARFLLKNETAAGFASLAYAFSPDLFYFGFSALPDILALASSVWGLYLFLRWFFEHKTSNYILSLLFVTLAGLTKIQFLAIGAMIAIVVLQNRTISLKYIYHLIFYGMVSVGLTLWWYITSVQMIESSGLRDFGITFKPVSDFSKGVDTILKNIISDLPDILLNYASFLLLIAGLVFFFKNKSWKNQWFYPLLAWSVILLVYHIIELGQMDVHSYYMMPYLPLLFLVCGYGIKCIVPMKRSAAILIFLLVAEPILACVRIIPSRLTKADPGIPIELYNKVSVKIH